MGRDFTTKLTKHTKGLENYYSELRALRVLRGEIGFLHEHGNLGVPVRKICASHAIFELLQCKGHKKFSGEISHLGVKKISSLAIHGETGTTYDDKSC